MAAPRRSTRGSKLPAHVSSMMNSGKEFPEQGNVFQQLGIEKGDVIVLDQGDRGTCCAHAVTGCHHILRKCTTKLEWSDVHSCDWENQESLHAGNRFIGALVAECAALAESSGQRKIKEGRGGQRGKGKEGGECEWVKAKFFKLSPGDVQAVKLRILSGQPVAVALEIFRAGVRGGKLTLSNHKASQLKEADYEQHAVAVVGYRDDSGAEGGGWFTILNSHGQKWGFGDGFGEISFKFYETYCREAYAATVAL